MVKNLPAMQETWVPSLCQEDPWRRDWLSIPVFMPGEVCEERYLAGYHLWGCNEQDMTERLTLSFTFS